MPLVIAQGETTPIPPLWLAVAVQLQWPPESVEQVVLVQPSAEMAPATFEHSTLTDDTDKHAGARGNVMVPAVTVLSVYVPSLFAVHVPVTCSDPVTGTLAHPRLDRETSMSPASARHDDVTLQVPTTDPPQVGPPGQFWGADVPPVPPEPVVPPVPPPVVLEPLQPLFAIADARAAAPTRPMSLIRIYPRGLLSVRLRSCSGFFDSCFFPVPGASLTVPGGG